MATPPQEMDLEQHGDNMPGKGGAGQVYWSNAMSSFVLKYLADLVASGTKTTSGFKQAHLNSCARALYEKLGVQRTGGQVGNHLRKWKRIYAKIEKLKNLNGAVWDEHNCIISLDAEHYNNHIKDHREDANYLNIPIEHYHEMATICGKNLAAAYAKGSNEPLGVEVTETYNAPTVAETGAYANGSNEPLGVEVTETDSEPIMTETDYAPIVTETDNAPTVTETDNAPTVTGTDNAPKPTSSEPSEQIVAHDGTHSGNNGAESSGTKQPPSKKQRIYTDDDLVVLMSRTLGELASSIKKLSEQPDLPVPKGLYEELKSIPGFDEAHLEHYYAYLCENPPLARAFYALPQLSSKVIWVARYIKNHRSELM
ncbi:uncharacterized protein [Miscanthus floridulus]|uniref:uncharacterized protein isoform X2 n=1 Tax=Miscanthus floridulus TaxID=154761 RepID=UPI003457C35B